MLRKLMLIAIVGALGAGLAYNAKDILRYLKIRQM